MVLNTGLADRRAPDTVVQSPYLCSSPSLFGSCKPETQRKACVPNSRSKNAKTIGFDPSILFLLRGEIAPHNGKRGFLLPEPHCVKRLWELQAFHEALMCVNVLETSLNVLLCSNKCKSGLDNQTWRVLAKVLNSKHAWVSCLMTGCAWTSMRALTG